MYILWMYDLYHKTFYKFINTLSFSIKVPEKDLLFSTIIFTTLPNFELFKIFPRIIKIKLFP
ncbi:hypothetical protein D9V80_01290 [Buchnera aphidicola (Thelaxes californica)]|uniref:Uncharacterized protein n=1 Tax=Buchnera aphidicola (Thelaxes californica) TaxID=1315998 RepID=A0A4D6YLC2_9GAMM|nr:hypothetical protein [Buchnera aphidicola]QCI26790.1 hypothetical protein D9V80_01290 [Buchnera aphidicola (Thelaxes californica)]